METKITKITNTEAKALIKHWNKYIKVVAFNFKNPDYYEDLISVGHIALIEAAEKFDSTKHLYTDSYYSKQIKWAMMKFLSDYSRIVRIPRDILQTKDEEKKIFHDYSSIDTPLNDKGDTLAAFIPDNNPSIIDIIDSNFQKNKLKEAVAKLKPQWQFIIEETFDLYDQGKPISITEIGELLNISKQAVAQQYTNAIKELKKHMGSKNNEITRKVRIVNKKN